VPANKKVTTLGTDLKNAEEAAAGIEDAGCGATAVLPDKARPDDSDPALAARAIARWEGEGGRVPDLSKRVS
jgi:hypothetical protein